MSKESSTKQRPLSKTEAKARHEQMVEVARDLAIDSADLDFHSDQSQVPTVEVLNNREITSIYALLAYVSYNQNVQQETVQMIVEAHFGVDNIAKIRRSDYMRAIEFLVDLRMDEIIN